MSRCASQLLSAAVRFFLRSVGPIDCLRLQVTRRGTGVPPPPMCHWKVASLVEGYDVLPDGGPWGLL
jgi:hypothetical protein